MLKSIQPESSRQNLGQKKSLLMRLLEIGNTDFCPNANRYVYWLKQPIGWFVIGLSASILAGMFVGPQGFILAGAIGAVIFLGVIWPWLSLRGIRVKLGFRRRRVVEGDTLVAVISVENRWPIPVWGLAMERGFPLPDGNETGPWLALSRIGPWTETEFDWAMTAPQRGVYPSQPCVVSNGFPFGIWRCEHAVEMEESVFVWPKTFPLRSFPEIVGDSISIEGCETLKAGQEGEVVDIRNFRIGDTLRQVHWAQTARRGTLMVRERQNKSRREVRVVLDIDPEIHFGSGPNGSFEWGMRVAASICREFHAHHFHVSCTLGSDVISVPDHLAGIKPILDAMAKFRPEQVADPRLRLADLRKTSSAGSQIEYIVTTRLRKQKSLGAANLESTANRHWIILQEASSAELHNIDGGPHSATLNHRPIDLASNSFSIPSMQFEAAQ
ncbi:MAG: DUF58 domain-containing protein [Pirellulaceae bacterium]|nr:DUF58 domain-containing protein [Pirellulaceae bacterium]